ncbi:MAG: serine hydrolase [Kordiimonadaceae bacterium]|nr:serine hydrolase [Kordiimonadaceae bacterium]
MKFTVLKQVRTYAAAAALTGLVFGHTAIVAAGTEPVPLTSAEINSLVTTVMEKYNVPGMAVGVVKDGTIVHLEAYGVRRAGEAGTVDTNTLFGIASNSKAFTTSAIALLVADGKLRWDDKVIDHIPNFRLHDAWVTREFTVKDLVVHNSGLGLGAGDLMVWPTSDRSRSEIIQNLRYLKPESSFRSEYAYDNLLYIVAGEVIAAASGMSFGEFVNKRLMKPLGMARCAADRRGLKGEENYAKPHVKVDGKLLNVEPSEVIDRNPVWSAAGGVQCSIEDMMKWVAMHLRGGKLPDGSRLISKRQHKELWTPQTILSVGSVDRKWNNTHYRSYGLGFNLQDSNGHRIISHGGTLLGMISHTRMVPELGLGVVVLTNQQAYPGRDAIVYSIIKSYITSERVNWLDRFDTRAAKAKAYTEKRTKKAMSIGQESKIKSLAVTHYQGRYRDLWFGDVVIKNQQDTLYFTADKAKRLKGKLEHFNGNVFIVRWDDRSLEADAYVSFNTSITGTVKGMRMKAVSPATDFSFDFHDLDFTKVKEAKTKH